MAIVIQLKKAKETEIWYFRHSCPTLQLGTSATYNIVTPAEAEAAARESVAVTCKNKNKNKDKRMNRAMDDFTG